jgi:hypothetical protein
MVAIPHEYSKEATWQAFLFLTPVPEYRMVGELCWLSKVTTVRETDFEEKE